MQVIIILISWRMNKTPKKSFRKNQISACSDGLTVSTFNGFFTSIASTLWGKSLNWSEDYLTIRTQKVKYNKTGHPV